MCVLPPCSVCRQCRHLSYRTFVSWCWGSLGRSVRVVIPSCVVLRIRREFPDASGQYVGFRPPLDWTVTNVEQQHPPWKACRAEHTGAGAQESAGRQPHKEGGHGWSLPTPVASCWRHSLLCVTRCEYKLFFCAFAVAHFDLLFIIKIIFFKLTHCWLCLHLFDRVTSPFGLWEHKSIH